MAKRNHDSDADAPPPNKRVTRAPPNWTSLPGELWALVFARLPLWYLPLVSLTWRSFLDIIKSLDERPSFVTGAVPPGAWAYEQEWRTLSEHAPHTVLRHPIHSSSFVGTPRLGCSSFEPMCLGRAICRNAAACGYLSVLIWAREQGCPWNEQTCSAAAAGGHLEVLQWARERGCPWDEPTCTAAAAGGHLEVLQWARSKGCPWEGKAVCAAAMGEGQLPVLRWLLKEGCDWDRGTATCTAAAAGLEMLQFVRRQGAPWHGDTCDVAASRGNLPALRWAREQGCPWDAWTCTAAAASGHLDVLIWARENGCPWNDDVCSSAAAAGRLDILQAARERGCPWDEDTCVRAAGLGQLEVLMWAREHGCPWNEEVCEVAAKRGHLAVLKWARENGCPWNESVCSAAAKLGGTMGLAILCWAWAQGAPWDEATLRNASRCGGELFRWAWEHGAPWTEETLWHSGTPLDTLEGSALPVTVLETSRLLLITPPPTTDAQEMQSILSCRTTMQHLLNMCPREGPWSLAAVEDRIKAQRRAQEEGRACTFHLYRKEGKALIGVGGFPQIGRGGAAGLSSGEAKGLVAWSGIILAESAWGVGYASEALLRIWQFGLAKYSFNSVTLQTRESNAPMRRFCERHSIPLVGVRKGAIIDHDGAMASEVEYRFSLKRWPTVEQSLVRQGQTVREGRYFPRAGCG